MYDVTIVGCGVVGASLAYTLSQYRLRVLVLERENDVAMGTTKANSAIVHAGYDPENGTLMAKLNVRGSELMEQLCSDLSVGYKRIGSFVLAFDEEQKKHLEHLLENGVRNGVPGLRILDAEEAHEMEPNLAENVAAALYAPSAAVIDPWGLCIAEAETAVRNGVELRLRSEVTGLEDKGGHVLVHTKSGDYETKVIVNCAGGWGGDICAMTGETEWEAQPSRGEYYLLDKSSGNLVSHVIFQCPNKLGKGVLVSPTVHGNLIVGPNAVDVDAPDSRENTLAGMDFVAETSRRSVPSIDFRQSIRNFAGVRANTSESDFIIRPAKNMPRLLHIAGIKSPGRSACDRRVCRRSAGGHGHRPRKEGRVERQTRADPLQAALRRGEGGSHREGPALRPHHLPLRDHHRGRDRRRDPLSHHALLARRHQAPRRLGHGPLSGRLLRPARAGYSRA